MSAATTAARTKRIATMANASSVSTLSKPQTITSDGFKFVCQPTTIKGAKLTASRVFVYGPDSKFPEKSLTYESLTALASVSDDIGEALDSLDKSAKIGAYAPVPDKSSTSKQSVPAMLAAMSADEIAALKALLA